MRHPKRLCVDSGYFETYNRPNVVLVDVANDPIEEITTGGVRTRGGASYELDDIVFATGFDAMTGAVREIDIRVANGTALRDRWSSGPRTYLGLMVSGFPNLFLVAGPGSPSVKAQMVVAIEQHVDWIADCIAYLRAHRLFRIEANEGAESAWVQFVQEVADATLYPLANSWYFASHLPNKSRVFMVYVGGFANYRQKCEEVAVKGYSGFTLTP